MGKQYDTFPGRKARNAAAKRAGGSQPAIGFKRTRGAVGRLAGGTRRMTACTKYA